MIQDHLDQQCWDEGWNNRKKRNKKYTSRYQDEDTDRYTYKSVKTGSNLTLVQTEGMCYFFRKKQQISSIWQLKGKATIEGHSNKTKEMQQQLISTKDADYAQLDKCHSHQQHQPWKIAKIFCLGFCKTNGSCYMEIDMKNCILLDIQSTIHYSWNQQMMTGICESPSTITIKIKSGSSSTNLHATLPGLGDVWFDSKHGKCSRLCPIEDRYWITIDLSIEPAYCAHEKYPIEVSQNYSRPILL